MFDSVQLTKYLDVATLIIGLLIIDWSPECRMGGKTHTQMQYIANAIAFGENVLNTQQKHIGSIAVG